MKRRLKVWFFSLSIWHKVLWGVAFLVSASVICATTWQQSQVAPQSPITVLVARSNIESEVTALGSLQPKRYVDVGAQVSGQILRLHAQPGDLISKGTLLVEIDPSVQKATVDADHASLKALKAQSVDEMAQLKLATLRYARIRELSKDRATSLDNLQSAEATLTSTGARVDQLRAQISQTLATLNADEARLGYTRIYAPMTGSVVSVDAREGQTLNATYQTPNILRVADLTQMTVWAEVSEADVGNVKPGMRAYFTSLGDDQRRWEGRVRQVLPAPPNPTGGGAATIPANSKVVVYTVLFDVDNSDSVLMPQMTAQVTFVQEQAINVLTVPITALIQAGTSPDIFAAKVRNPDGSIESREVRVGARNRYKAQVLSGLALGEQLLSSNSYSQRPQQRLRLLIQRLGGLHY